MKKLLPLFALLAVWLVACEKTQPPVEPANTDQTAPQAAEPAEQDIVVAKVGPEQRKLLIIILKV